MASKKKGQKPKWRQEGNRMVCTLPNSVADMVKTERAARRQAAIETGTLNHGGRGGVHGGDKRTQHRRNRADSRQAIREGRFE